MTCSKYKIIILFKNTLKNVHLFLSEKIVKTKQLSLENSLKVINNTFDQKFNSYQMLKSQK